MGGVGRYGRQGNKPTLLSDSSVLVSRRRAVASVCSDAEMWLFADEPTKLRLLSVARLFALLLALVCQLSHGLRTSGR